MIPSCKIVWHLPGPQTSLAAISLEILTQFLRDSKHDFSVSCTLSGEGNVRYSQLRISHFHCFVPVLPLVSCSTVGSGAFWQWDEPFWAAHGIHRLWIESLCLSVCPASPSVWVELRFSPHLKGTPFFNRLFCSSCRICYLVLYCLE